ncbi:MAG: serine/threonine protein kinase [Gemmataceae bacterium]|nr:serine/threonine protein kinase [Gemmataceae bacterium]
MPPLLPAPDNPEDSMDQPRPKPLGSPVPSSLPEDTDAVLVQDSNPTPFPEDSDETNFHSMGSTRVLSLPDQPPSTDDSEDSTDMGSSKRGISTLGDYKLVKKLGEGAMGVVYKAKRISDDRMVALKVLFPHIAANPKLVQRLRREGLVMGELDHPNIVQAFDFDEKQGWYFVAMEYVDGVSLQKWINRLGKLDLGDALHVTLAVCRALDYAHNLGFIHRDIKPDNVLIKRDGQVKLTDLGMVKTLDEEMALTQTGHAVGTPWYMPLEQARNAKETDGRCDIYAMGCMLYCMLTGNPPFTGKTIVEVIQAKEVGTFPPARQHNPEVPERLDLMLIKMTAKQARYRYANCVELMQDLDSLSATNERLRFLEGRKYKPTQVLDGPSSSVEIPSDIWYVRTPMGGGDLMVKKFTTAELKKLLEDGAVDPIAQASQNADDGFRALSTFKEFQGTAFVMQTKRAADLQAAKYRHLYKKIEEKDKQREEAEKKPETAPSYYSGMWVPALAIVGGILGGILLLYFLFKVFR